MLNFIRKFVFLHHQTSFDMSEIDILQLHEKHLASWAGIFPGNNESAGKKAEESLMVTNK